jgi:hypothetical protein
MERLGSEGLLAIKASLAMGPSSWLCLQTCPLIKPCAFLPQSMCGVLALMLVLNLPGPTGDGTQVAADTGVAVLAPLD